MAITVQPVTPGFAAEIGDVDLSAPLGASEVQGYQRRFRHIRGPDLSRPASVAGPAPRFRPPLRPARNHDRAASQGRKAARAQGICRRLQSRPGKPGVGQGFAAAHVPARQPALAHRQLVQTAAGASVTALCADYSAGRRPYRICRRTRGLRRVARRDEAPDRRTSWWNTRSSRRARGSVSPISATRSAKACRRCRRCWCAPFPRPAANRCTLHPMPAVFSAMPEDEGRALIDQLVAHATQRQFVYTHRWRVHDLVIWDNRCTMHRGADFDDLRWKRDMQRATVCDIANSCEQAGIAVEAAE